MYEVFDRGSVRTDSKFEKLIYNEKPLKISVKNPYNVPRKSILKSLDISSKTLKNCLGIFIDSLKRGTDKKLQLRNPVVYK